MCRQESVAFNRPWLWSGKAIQCGGDTGVRVGPNQMTGLFVCESCVDKWVVLSSAVRLPMASCFFFFLFFPLVQPNLMMLTIPKLGA